MNCVSKCKGLAKSACKDECTYVSDKYCRLSPKYKMDENCNIISRSKTKKNPSPKLKTVSTRPKTVSARSPKLKTVSTRPKTVSARSPKPMSNSQPICSTSGECLTFGKEREKNLFFEFDKFTYATTFRSIGEKSANGFVKEIKYERNGLVEYAILKTPLKKTSDNLAYEYLVGQYVNTKAIQYPCFVETYGLFLYTTSQLNDLKKKGSTDMKTMKRVDPFDFKTVCNSSTRLGLLTQNIKDAVTIGSQVSTYDFLHYDSAFCLYQVYFVLAQLRKEFTHYDLNLNNVLLYTPMKNGYIQYHYHGNKTTTFKSKYMVKLIDYGRCYIPSSMDYESKVCAHCKDCGRQSGLRYLHKDRKWDYLDHHTNSAYKNESMDLRLFLGVFYENKHTSDIITPLHEMTKNIAWGYKRVGQINMNGVIENLQTNKNINNVGDAESHLSEFIHTSKVKKMNDEYYAKDKKIADLHIYTDRPLVFIPV
jgi:hypothetical protein